eukprot:TRINITY_DN4389_c0_g2_i1.p1 TRINITY_DN4389_c0_g2~~TRINITY_DN4389_c0_g2_i1.p1  ORF type:complete len:247 (+),score=27.29 TRINITY_DN4389_c0_g2_i1:93-743(+)
MLIIAATQSKRLQIQCRQGSKRKRLSAKRHLEKPVQDQLCGSSIILLGHNTQLQNDLAINLAAELQYSPLLFQSIIDKYNKKNEEEEGKELSQDEIVDLEKQVIESASTQLRCCIATTGSGAAFDEEFHKFLYGHMIIHIDKEDYEKNLEKAEIRLKIDEDFDVNSQDDIEELKQDVLDAIINKLLHNRDLPKRKQLYIKLGCRGDWPDITIESLQ